MCAANKELSRRFTELFSTDDEALADEIFFALPREVATSGRS